MNKRKRVERIVGVLLGGNHLKTETKQVYVLGKTILDNYPILSQCEVTLIDRVRNHVPSSSDTLARSMKATSLFQLEHHPWL